MLVKSLFSFFFPSITHFHSRFHLNPLLTSKKSTYSCLTYYCDSLSLPLVCSPVDRCQSKAAHQTQSMWPVVDWPSGPAVCFPVPPSSTMSFHMRKRFLKNVSGFLVVRVGIIRRHHFLVSQFWTLQKKSQCSLQTLMYYLFHTMTLMCLFTKMKQRNNIQCNWDITKAEEQATF